MTRADVPAWNRLLAAIEAEDRSGEHCNEDDLHEEIDDPALEIGKDVVGLFHGAELLGYFLVRRREVADGHHKIHLEGGVRPDVRGQGLGTRVARAMYERAIAAHREVCPDVPAVLATSGLSADTAQADLLATIGMRTERYTFTMAADLRGTGTPAAPAAEMPEGFVLRGYDRDVDAAMLEAHNASFVDHRGFTPWAPGMWEQWVAGSRNFRPQHSAVVVERDDPGRVAAYLQSNEFDAETEATGRREAYVAKLGTRREHRGRGLASLLLRHCLDGYRDAGYDGATLDVDSENPTGALGIYERAGFVVRQRWSDYELVVPPAG